LLDRLEFLLSEAFVSLRRNTWMTFAAVTTAAMALFLLGGLVFAVVGLGRLVGNMGDRLEMKVFLKDSVPIERARGLRETLLKIDGVSTVRFVPKDEGLRQFLKDNPNIDLEGLEIDNPLPDAYVVRVRNEGFFNEAAWAIQALPEVEPDGVKYPAEEKDFLAGLMRAVPWFGVTTGGIMLATSGILIYNAIRMTIVARRREIRIMNLVGATRAMVWTPLLIEGAVQGALGGFLATLVLWAAHRIIDRTVFSKLDALGAFSQFPFQAALVWLVAAGAAYGTLCSLIAVRDPAQWRKRAA
jgi:cell division transport system permease protein